jgi:hypothetical protein
MRALPKYLYRFLVALGLATIVYQLSSCARRPAWNGFSHPAYLPASQPRVHRLDSTAAANWAPRPNLFQP